MLDKINRLRESLKNETDLDVIKSLKAVLSGMTNYYFKSNQARMKAEERYNNSCKDCAFNVLEPIESMRVEDKEIPELSHRMCGHCGGCVLSYKLRQSVKKCEFWKD